MVKKKSKSSKRWLQEHFSDKYVKSAQAEGYRSRAAYKLLEIQKQERIFRVGQTVVDLGAAPGGWSQVASSLLGKAGRVYALDLLAMQPIAQVEFVQGDFTDEEIFTALLAKLENREVDVVLSDMAPNISGIKAVDQPRAIYLAELALEFACRILKKGGVLLLKTFQGQGFEQLLKALRTNFEQVKTIKPEASRARSSELYLLAKGFKKPL